MGSSPPSPKLRDLRPTAAPLDAASAATTASPARIDDVESNRRAELFRLAAALKRHKRGAKPQPALAVVIGAGVSLGAGVPLTKSWIPLLWRFYLGEALNKADVEHVLEAQKCATNVYRAYRSDLQRAGERAQREIRGYEKNWLQEHPKHYVDEYQCIMQSLSSADQQRAVSAILDICEPTKITWTYLRIAQLVDAGYVDSILTTNLDLVLVKALSLFNVIPAICDFHPAAELRSSHAGGPQIIYLHGNRHSYNIRNTQNAVASYGQPLKELLRSITKDRSILVSGYSGWSDGLMGVLKERYPDGQTDTPNEVYWAFHDYAPAVLPLKNQNVHYMQCAPCDMLFEDLANALELPPPPLVENPLKYFGDLLGQIDASASPMTPFRFKEKLARIVAAEKTHGDAEAFRIITTAQSGQFRKARRLVDAWLAPNSNVSPDQVVSLARLLPHQRPRPGKQRLNLKLYLLEAATDRSDLGRNKKLLRAQADALFANGQRLSVERKWQEAVAIFRKVLKISPVHREALVYLGEALLELRDYKGAEHAYRKQIEIDPKHPFAWNNLGVTQERGGDVDAAIVSYRKQTKINPRTEHSWNNLASLLDGKGKKADALRAYRQQVKVYPRHPDAWTNMGSLLQQKKDVRGAIAAHRKQLEVNPRHGNAWNKLGFALKQSGDWNGAINSYRKQLEVSPSHTGSRHNLAIALWKQGRLGEAAECYHLLLKAEPNNASALSNDAELSLIRGDLKRFQKRLKKVLSLPKPAPNTVVVMAFLKWLSRLNSPDAALLTVLETRTSGGKIDWDFSDIQPFITKLPKAKRLRAKALIEFFAGHLSLAQLKRKLKL